MAVGTAPLARIDAEEALRILRRAADLGATWWDTSDDYGSLPLLTRLLPTVPRARLTISSKTAAHSEEEGYAAVQQQLRELGTEYLDIIFLHNVLSEDDFAARRGCLQAFQRCKAEGLVKAIGFSSHRTSPILLAAQEPAIDVVLAPWNFRGVLPDGGSLPEMAHAIRRSYEAGKGVVLMKVLGAGALHAYLDEAIRQAVQFPYKHALNLGVDTVKQLEVDIRLANGQQVDTNILRRMKSGASWGKAA